METVLDTSDPQCRGRVRVREGWANPAIDRLTQSLCVPVVGDSVRVARDPQGNLWYRKSEGP